MRIYLPLLLLALISCNTTGDNVTTNFFHNRANQKPYNKTLEKYIRSTTVYFNYETLYNLDAAFLSSTFFDALNKRVKDHFQNTEILKDININSTIFLSLFTPNREMSDLSNTRLWELFLTVDGKRYPVKSIKMIKEKEAWNSFFPFINPWTNDYIVSFDIPHPEELSPDSHYVFTLNNSEAGTSMKW